MTRASRRSNVCRSFGPNVTVALASSPRRPRLDGFRWMASIPRRRTSSSTGGRTAALPSSTRQLARFGLSSRARSRARSAPTRAARRSAGAARRFRAPLAFARRHGVDPSRSVVVGGAQPIARWRTRSEPTPSQVDAARHGASSRPRQAQHPLDRKPSRAAALTTPGPRSSFGLLIVWHSQAAPYLMLVAYGWEGGGISQRRLRYGDRRSSSLPWKPIWESQR